MRQWKPLIFILAVSVVFFLPNPESLIVRIVERAGFVLILARGLMAHYDDFCKLLSDGKGRR